MKKTTKVVLAIFFVTFILPILGMMNCPSWNEGSMSGGSCIIDGYIFREYANFCYEILLISAFMLFIPLIIYVFFVFAFTNMIVKDLNKSEQENSNKIGEKDINLE